MISYWQHDVVRRSICPSVTLCIVAFRVGVHGWKLYQRVHSRQLPIHFFRHFCCRMYRLATKRTGRNELEKSNSSLFRHRQKPHALDAGCYLRTSAGCDRVLNKQTRRSYIQETPFSLPVWNLNTAHLYRTLIELHSWVAFYRNVLRYF